MAPRIARSPITVWPAAIAPLVNTTWLPTVASWPMWAPTSSMLWSPIVVMPTPNGVPPWIVTCSRIRLCAPMRSLLATGWPAFSFLSCGVVPTTQNG